MSEEHRTEDDIQPGSDSPDGDEGEGGKGGAGGTGDAAEQFAAEREALQREARVRQSEADKAKAEVARLQAELAAKDEGASGGETPTLGMTEEQARQVMRREMARARELADAVETAKKDYPDALPAVFAELDKYDSADDLLVAAKASHDQFADHRKAIAERVEAETRARYAERYGELPAPSTPEDEGGAAGEPTVAQLSAMTQAQLDALEARSPGLIARVLRSADQLTT